MARSGPARRTEFELFRPVQTRWNDNDAYGHLNNAVHYQLFDTAINSWLIEAGLLTLRGSDTVFIVAETGCRYHAEIMFPDLIQAGLRIARLGGSSVTWEIGLFRGDDDLAAAEGRFVHVHVARDGMRPAPLSQAQRDGLAALVVA